MAILRKSKIREMSQEERDSKVVELKGELLVLRAKTRSGSVESAGQIKNIRRTIARIKTITNEEKSKHS